MIYYYTISHHKETALIIRQPVPECLSVLIFPNDNTAGLFRRFTVSQQYSSGQTLFVEPKLGDHLGAQRIRLFFAPFTLCPSGCSYS